MCAKLARLMEDRVTPRHVLRLHEAHDGPHPISFMGELKAPAREEELWKLFLPHLVQDKSGTRLSTLDHAHFIGRSLPVYGGYCQE